MSVYPILASACLCGVPCRYDGRAVPHAALERLHAEGKVIAVCPELLGGLDAPRNPCERSGSRVHDTQGRDLTEAFQSGASRTLALAREKGITVAVLKDKSPSCGNSVIYDGTFSGRVIPGQGVTAELLRENGLTVYSDESFQGDLP